MPNWGQIWPDDASTSPRVYCMLPRGPAGSRPRWLTSHLKPALCRTPQTSRARHKVGALRRRRLRQIRLDIDHAQRGLRVLPARVLRLREGGALRRAARWAVAVERRRPILLCGGAWACQKSCATAHMALLDCPPGAHRPLPGWVGCARRVSSGVSRRGVEQGSRDSGSSTS